MWLENGITCSVFTDSEIIITVESGTSTSHSIEDPLRMERSNSTLMSPVVVRSTLSIINAVNFVFGVGGGILWCTYLASGRGSGGQQSLSTGQWPKCSLRLSTRLYMFVMIMWDTIGILTLNANHIIFLIFDKDLQNVITDYECRAIIFVSYIASDAGTFHFLCICLERFVLVTWPTSSYAVQKFKLKSAILIISVTNALSIALNVFIILSNESVCDQNYRRSIYLLFKLICRVLIPFGVMVGSLSGLIISLIKRRSGATVSSASTAQNQEYDSAIFSSKLLLCGASFLWTATIGTAINIQINRSGTNGIIVVNYYSSSGFYSLVGVLLLWTAVWSKSYIFMLSSPKMRRDICIILKAMFGIGKIIAVVSHLPEMMRTRKIAVLSTSAGCT